MADQKISQLSPIAAGSVDRANDLLELSDVSLGQSFKVTPNALFNISSSVVGTTDTQTLTNKTITAPSISSPVLSGTITGTYTLGGTPTFPSSVVTLTGTQTLTNKTLTSPTINTPTISNATITANAISGFTTANSGTVYGVSIVLGIIQSAALVNQVNTAAIQNGAVGGAQLSTSAITLGYAQITANITTTATTATQATGLTATVTIPAGGRRVRVSFYSFNITNNTAARTVDVSIWDGVVGAGTQLTQASNYLPTANSGIAANCSVIITPAAGSKTYNIGFSCGAGGTTSIGAASIAPSYILVEAI